jgi:hypothetical protein
MVIRRSPNPSPSPTHDEQKLGRKGQTPADANSSPDPAMAKRPGSGKRR